MELRSPLHLGVVANEKGAFGIPLDNGHQPYIYIYIAIGLVSRAFADGPGDRGSLTSRVIPKAQKMVLDTTLLNIILPLHLGVVAIEKEALGSLSTTVADITFFRCIKI